MKKQGVDPLGNPIPVSQLYALRNIVVQPTTLCNLDCGYCYLPDRARALHMQPSLARKIARDLSDADHHVSVLWHGGEPLASGIALFRELLNPFEPLRKEGKIDHIVQTNATLVNAEWCELFSQYEFSVGISVDGPAAQNANRLDWAGRSTYDRTMKGIDWLKAWAIDFSAIAVVNETNVDEVDRLFDFFRDLGCSSLGINFEEMEGTNHKHYRDESKVRRFWRQLFDRWSREPVFRVREFARALSWMEALTSRGEWAPFDYKHDIFPTISHRGEVFMLSPELNGASGEKYGRFIAGNVLDTPLLDIVQRSYSLDYVVDSKKGVQACQATCEYFSFCLGGQASNKYYENGTMNSAETQACKNTQKYVVDVILDAI